MSGRANERAKEYLTPSVGWSGQRSRGQTELELSLSHLHSAHGRQTPPAQHVRERDSNRKNSPAIRAAEPRRVARVAPGYRTKVPGRAAF
eukprot:1200724-Rhodomonas_salina.1